MAVGDAATLGLRLVCEVNGGREEVLPGAGRASGGGGNGAILSLAAAAAAAEAYLRVSPGALVGNAAGFILLLEPPFGKVERGACNVANAGNGLFNWVEGLRAAEFEASVDDVGFGFPGKLFDLASVSAISS